MKSVDHRKIPPGSVQGKPGSADLYSDEFQGKNFSDGNFSVLLVREYYLNFGKSGNKFVTKKFFYQCVCKGVN